MSLVDSIMKVGCFRSIADTTAQGSKPITHNGISARLTGADISSNKMEPLIGGSAKPPRVIGDLFLRSPTADQFSGSNPLGYDSARPPSSGYGSDGSIYPKLGGLEVPETPLNDSQKADNGSALSDMVYALKVNKSLFFGSSHKTKTEAKKSALALQKWAKTADVETMKFTVTNFMKDMQRVIDHKFITNRAEAQKLSRLALDAIDSALHHAQKNIPETPASEEELLHKMQMEKYIDATLVMVNYHGFDTKATQAFLKRDDIKN